MTTKSLNLEFIHEGRVEKEEGINHTAASFHPNQQWVNTKHQDLFLAQGSTPTGLYLYIWNHLKEREVDTTNAEQGDLGHKIAAPG